MSTPLDKLFEYADLVGRIQGVLDMYEDKEAIQRIRQLVEEFEGRKQR